VEKNSSTPHKIKFDRNFKFHYGYCKHKDSDTKAKRMMFFEEVFLLEIVTETLKVLLVQDLEVKPCK
jgi:hypothetical protein